MLKSKWMSNLDGDISLKDVTVPGSHDAGTWDIHMCSPWNSARTGTAAKFAKLARYTMPWINSNYSKTQNLDLVDQFRQGVRYFDLRVAKHEGQYRFTHGLLGSDFLDGIKDLINYSDNFKEEIIICDIRFIFGFTPQDHQTFQNSLLNIIGDRLASSDKFNASTKLSKFWDKQKNIIVIYHSNHKVDQFWSRDRVTSIWPNATDSRIAIDRIDKYIANLGDNSNVFYGIQAVLTPDTQYVATHLWSSTIALSENLNKKLMYYSKKWKGASFIMYDVVEYPGLADVIIQLNF